MSSTTRASRVARSQTAVTRNHKEPGMTPSVQTLAAIVLFIFLALMVTLLVLVLTGRSRRRAPASTPAPEAPADPAVDVERRLVSDRSAELRRLSIVEQQDSIERFSKRRMGEIMAAMVDSREWQTLVKQIDELSEERLAHLRILANRTRSGLVPAEALHHTLKVYSVTELLLGMDRQLVHQSGVVSHVLDDWFRTHRGLSLAEFEARLHLDAARILLLDLDYAHPPVDVLLSQLSLAEEHCKAAAIPGEPATALSPLLLSEIALRRRRARTGS